MDLNLKERVQEALNTMRPFLQADGGDVELLNITEEMTVQLRLLGACSTCDLSHMTMKAGVEEAIIKSVPEIVKVEAI